MVRFDTSVIPDGAAVTGATLTLQIAGGILNPDTRNLNFEWYPWTAMATSDYIDPVGSTANATAISALTTNPVVNSFVLANPSANVNKTGYTGLRFGISGGAPVGVNDLFYYVLDDAPQEPRLIVDYSTAGPGDDPPIGFLGRGAGW